jgi:lipoprotein-anchoring transpeptidase ErfK/SrfK
MRTLTALSAIYLASASVFGVAIAIQRNPAWNAAATRVGAEAWPAIKSGAHALNESAIKPAVAQIVAWDRRVFAYLDGPPAAAPKLAQVPAKKKAPPAPVVVAAHKPAAPPPLRPATTETPHDQVATATPSRPAFELAPQQQQQAPAAPAPRPDVSMPGPAELTRVMLRLKDNLTGEMLANFELFLYVSKASSGPWAQRMYVFGRQAGGDLKLMYNWPVSTGREIVEYAPNGQRAPSFTPQGYYELDPGRMYRHHTSGQWGQPMPYAMFFNWQTGGMQTGLAIHAAHGADIALLGQRASAGCVRLAPENAAMLFNLIRTQYKGLAPRFAMDRRTATMSNDGLLMHDADGKLKFAEGYKVLVFIENYGGDNVVAAVF